MQITLAKRFSTSNQVDEYDVKKIKKSLNLLGYYQPLKTTGITEIPDKNLFEAIKTFQADYKLPVTGTLAPDDETVTRLNQEISKTPDGYYIWRTVEDNKVRGSHAALNGTVRAWNDSPDPGQEFNCRCWAEPLSSTKADRKSAILGNGKADFRLKPDLHPNDKKPFYAMHMFSEVNENDNIIIREARLARIDPDLVRAIIYVETTQGYYDRGYELFNRNQTLRPMNIHAEFWKNLEYTRKQLETPRDNIKAGVELLKRIKQHAPHANNAEIATLYNDLGAKRVSDYGARVQKVFVEKPWLDQKKSR
jgi:peptidoglycan hydrolase-like protein with peptidoglycan-binding domain